MNILSSPIATVTGCQTPLVSISAVYQHSAVAFFKINFNHSGGQFEPCSHLIYGHIDLLMYTVSMNHAEGKKWQFAFELGI